jgi:hypothetical protein
LQEKEELSSFNPYKYWANEQTDGYYFITDCDTRFEFGFKKDSDFFGYELDGYNLLSFHFDKKIFAQKISTPSRISQTICHVIHETLMKNPQIPIWYICSLRPFKDRKVNQKNHEGVLQKNDSRPEFALCRQRLFTKWYQDNKDRFPEVKLCTYGVKETELNKEPVHLGFVYHQKFERIEELNSILTLLIAEEIDPDKEFYSQQY